MTETARLRKLADKCRQVAATLTSDQSADKLRAMAREFEAVAATENLPLISAKPLRDAGK